MNENFYYVLLRILYVIYYVIQYGNSWYFIINEYRKPIVFYSIYMYNTVS